jgi:peroxiredoxin
MNEALTKNRLTVILAVIIVLMGVEIAYLVIQNRRLQVMIEDPRQYFKTLKKGEEVPSLRGQDIFGENVSYRYSEDEEHTLLFWFSPTCSPCEDNHEFWNELYDQYHEQGVRFLGMCACESGEARDAATNSGFEFTIMSASDPFIVDAYKGNVLPQTVHVSPTGKILDVWPGALTSQQKNEIINNLSQLQTLKMEGGEVL